MAAESAEVSVTVDSDADENELARKRAAALRSKLFLVYVCHAVRRLLHTKAFAAVSLWCVVGCALMCLFGGNNSNVVFSNLDARDILFGVARGAVASAMTVSLLHSLRAVTKGAPNPKHIRLFDDGWLGIATNFSDQHPLGVVEYRVRVDGGADTQLSLEAERPSQGYAKELNVGADELKKGLRIASRRPSAGKGAPPPELFWSKIVAAALLSRERGTSKLTGTSWFLCLMIGITTAIWMMGIAVTAIVGKYYVLDVQPRLEYQIISGIVWWGVNPSFLTVWAIWLLSFALGAAACENEIRETKRAVLETDPSDGSGKWEQEVVCSLQRLRWRYLKRLHNGWETALTTFIVTLVAASLLALIFFINGSQASEPPALLYALLVASGVATVVVVVLALVPTHLTSACNELRKLVNVRRLEALGAFPPDPLTLAKLTALVDVMNDDGRFGMKVAGINMDGAQLAKIVSGLASVFVYLSTSQFFSPTNAEGSIF